MNLLEQMTDLAKKLEMINESSLKNKCKSCDKACNKTYCSKACKDKVNESNDSWNNYENPCIDHGHDLNYDDNKGIYKCEYCTFETASEPTPCEEHGHELEEDGKCSYCGFKINEINESKNNKCKSCNKSCTKTYCSKACKNKISESKKFEKEFHLGQGFPPIHGSFRPSDPKRISQKYNSIANSFVEGWLSSFSGSGTPMYWTDLIAEEAASFDDIYYDRLYIAVKRILDSKGIDIDAPIQ